VRAAGEAGFATADADTPPGDRFSPARCASRRPLDAGPWSTVSVDLVCAQPTDYMPRQGSLESLMSVDTSLVGSWPSRTLMSGRDLRMSMPFAYSAASRTG
jgi:hypothetical protein